MAADTIFAVSSGRPPAAIAVLRISGPDAFAAASAMCGSLPGRRIAALRTVRDAGGGVLDRALVLRFDGPDTATGEDLVEFHCHGGRAVVAAVETALVRQVGLRRAEPGEFTRRALTNGRIDLIEAQGLADLLNAETEGQRRAAIGAVEGRVSAAITDWMTRIADLSAQAEAMIDFAEEDDIADDPLRVTALVAAIRTLGRDIEAAVEGPPVERLRDGISVVLAGPPNSGKSTLLNHLARRDAAIVSDIAGTTRDRIEVEVVRAGIAYRLTDTAGLADRSDDAIERIGIDRARKAIDAADILLWLGDEPPLRTDAIWLHARADLPGRQAMPKGRALAVARSDLASVERVWDQIAATTVNLLPRVDALQLAALQQATCHAVAATLRQAPEADLVLIGEHLRWGRHELGRLMGINATEAMLDALFTRFCLGK